MKGSSSGLWTKSTSGMKRAGTKSFNEAWMCRNRHKDKLEDHKTGQMRHETPEQTGTSKFVSALPHL